MGAQAALQAFQLVCRELGGAQQMEGQVQYLGQVGAVTAHGYVQDVAVGAERQRGVQRVQAVFDLLAAHVGGAAQQHGAGDEGRQALAAQRLGVAEAHAQHGVDLVPGRFLGQQGQVDRAVGQRQGAAPGGGVDGQGAGVEGRYGGAPGAGADLCGSRGRDRPGRARARPWGPGVGRYNPLVRLLGSSQAPSCARIVSSVSAWTRRRLMKNRRQSPRRPRRTAPGTGRRTG